MKPLPAPPPPSSSDAEPPVPASTPQRTAALATLAGLMLAVAAPAEACWFFGCKNWPKHDANASDYHYPAPAPPAPDPPPDDGNKNPPDKKPKPSCDFCHAGLPVTHETLPVDDRYFPARLWQDPARFAQVHQMAVSRTADKRPFARPKPVEQVPPDLQTVFRAIARR